MNWNKYYAKGGDFGRLHDNAVDFIVSFVNATVPVSALDIGCGVGNLVRQLSSRGVYAIGVDPAAEAIKRAKGNNDGNEYIVGDINAVDGRFHLITCKHVYKFINDKPSFLKHVKSRLVTDGIFVLLTPTLDRMTQGKPAIAVDRTELTRELTRDFSVIAERELPGGLLLVCRVR